MKTFLIRTALFAALAGTAEATEAVEYGSYDSGVAAASIYQGRVDGKMEYVKFNQPSDADPTAYHPIKACVLQHGFGLAKKAIETAQLIDQTRGTTNVKAFAQLYWGKAFIERLLKDSCESVYVMMQESVNSSIREMVERDEKFLHDRVCTFQPTDLVHAATGKPQSGCAFVGHSKGGATAFNVARRCMSQESLLGQAGCEQLGKIFEASGVPTGAGAAALIYGVKTRLEEELRTGKIDPLAHRLKAQLLMLPKAVEAVALSAEQIIGWDEFGTYAPDTSNPIWYDLGPAYRMRDGEPTAVTNDVVLEHLGWLKGEFAAAGTKFRYDGSLTQTLGCGKPTPEPEDPSDKAIWIQSLATCRDVGNLATLYHASAIKEIYETGIAALQQYGQEALSLAMPNLTETFSWLEFQTSDGLVDYAQSMGPCHKGLGRENSAVTACFDYDNLNHMATTGTAMESLETMATWLAKPPLQ